ncbi:hypothetical protein [Paraburkholderia sp. DHOC27]|uniref:hypothetical protein n=1 Tax=Paraburkholderia sp. DHOC27 TaxID=2303330 RepID=UPI000E3D766F|nr:hypothetical protein [Paraburkholderia sp. DHOC27]RFU48537.1 hypothetical protein D0B32_01485 [Paraburkholderia sp. DHOC27]
MKITIPIALTLLLTSGMAFAWQPVVYPVRGQTPSQQNVDAALCYGMANRQTNVNITREAQAPMAPKPAPALAGSGGGVQGGQPPLPASGVGASSTLAGAAAPSGASGAMTAKGMPGMPAGAMPGSDAVAKTDKNGVPEVSGASGTSGASDAQPTTEAEVKLPPPPPPEPPMTRYWRAYGVCMQGKGYAVQ